MAKERLEIDIIARDEASAKFDALAKNVAAADKNVEALAKRVNTAFTGAQMVSAGRSLLNFAKIGVNAFGDLVSASSNLYEQQNFVNQVFKDAAPGLSAFAKGAAETLGMSERAALEGAANIGIFGRAVGIAGDDLVGFSSNLVSLAADMASVKNTTPEQAITALSAAFRGQYRPIKQYGVILNEVVLQHRALEMGIYDGTGKLTQQQKVLAINEELYHQLDFAVGDFARTSDQLANQQRILSAEWENTQAQLGDALRPAFIKAAGAAGDFLGVINGLPAPLKEIATNMGLTAVGIVAIGGVALLAAGKIVQLVDVAKTLRGSLQSAAEGGSKFSGSMLTLGRVVGVAGAVAVAIELVDTSINALAQTAEHTKESMQNLNIAIGEGNQTGIVKSFEGIINQQQRALKGFLGFTSAWESGGRKIQLTADGVTADIENVDRAWAKVMESGPEAGARVIAALEAQRAGLDKNSQQYKDITEIIARYTPKLEKAVQEQQALGTATDLTNESLRKYGKAGLDATTATEDADKAAEDLEKTLDTLTDNLHSAEAAFDSVKERAEVFGEVLKDHTGTTQVMDNFAAIRGSIDTLTQSWFDSEGAVRFAARALDTHTESGRENIKMLDDVASKIQDELIRVYNESNGSLEDVQKSAAKWTDELRWQMAAAGATTDEINDYIDTLNLTPTDIETVIRLQDQELAMRKLELLKLEMDNIDPEVATQIIAKVDEGDYIAAYDIAKGYITNRGPIPSPVKPTTSDKEAAAAKAYYDNWFARNPVVAAANIKINPYGGVGSVPYGPPVVRPNSTFVQGQAARPSGGGAEQQAMDEMGLQAIGGGLVSVPAPAMAGAYAPSSTAPIFNIHVNMPVGVNENKVVDLLKQYSRSNGRMFLPGANRR